MLTDRYIFSMMARAIARRQSRTWLERAAGFALAPHAVFYLRAHVKDLVPRVVVGRGAFDYWESGLDAGFGRDMYDSYVRYQSRLVSVFDQLAARYGFEVVDASLPPGQVLAALKASIARVFAEDATSPPS